MTDTRPAGWLLRAARGADARLAAILAPVSADAADRYLASSRVVLTIDRCFRRAVDVWAASTTAATLEEAWRAMTRDGRYRVEAIALVLLIGVVTHLIVTIAGGARPGWYWLVVPALVAAYAAMLLAGSRPARSSP